MSVALMTALISTSISSEASAFLYLSSSCPLSSRPQTSCQRSKTRFADKSRNFGRSVLMMVAAASSSNRKKNNSSGLRGNVLRSSSGARRLNDTTAPASGAAFDPHNPFFTSEFGEQELEDNSSTSPETEAEREKRLQEEDEWLLNFSRDDPDSHTETFSDPKERQSRARATKDRYDFTCLTVEEVARSYQVPISWVGDALCNFGVVPPIQWTARIGDVIDGDQAFALLEAMHGWDHAIMFDMYTWDSLRELAASHEIPIAKVLQVCDEEGFALPFGLRSHLRVEQYARLMRRLGMAQELTDHIREAHPDPDYPST